MANKRVEEKNAEMAEVTIDDSMENIPMQEIPKQQKERTSSEGYKKQEAQAVKENMSKEEIDDIRREKFFKWIDKVF